MTMRTGANPSRMSHARGAIKLLKLLNALAEKNRRFLPQFHFPGDF